ncbi:glycosyltransferase family 4 protein [Candidatus Nitrospira neomarina]|uniref:Glycosyltransferase family 4 protein n=1 Tax=Candidatus Nitrospira neomarina TaxID=3020899 RepID=A0AA96GEM7_9BACT|nr:glycosyltransferase family 4 protein [Candidatus Nitrospira neomarina]WNM60276.1 glycosyltransferase family 4 protein [Candidatus Nitrospira neomarina]
MLIPGNVFLISAGKFIHGAPRTWPWAETQARSLADLGWAVTLSVVDDRTSIRGIVRNVLRLRAEVARSGAEIVHAQYGTVTAAVADAARGTLPLVVSFCGDDLLGTPEPGLAWQMRICISRSIGLISAWRAQSLVVKSLNLLSALPTGLRRHAEIIPNGVDHEVFAPLNRLDARCKLGWCASQPIVLFNVGTRHNQRVKNLPLAQATMTELRQTYPTARLEVLSYAPQAEVALKMSAADCLLVTSLHEGSPNVVKEAMACNLPIVTVPCGDVEERLASVQPGCIAPYNASLLASSIRQVLEQGSRSNGRDRLMGQGLTAHAVATRLVRVYDRLRRETRFACVG